MRSASSRLVDDEVGDAVAEGLLLRGVIGGCGERGRSGNVGCDKERATRIVQLSRVEQLATEPHLGVSAGHLEQAGVGLRDTHEEIECRRR